MKPFQEKYENPESVLRGAPGPSPWYLRSFPPAVPHGFGWVEGDNGTIFITNNNQEVLTIFDYYCYVSSISQDRLLVWNAAKNQSGSFQDQADHIEFSILNLSQLSPIQNVSEAIKRLKEERLYLFHLDLNATTFLLRTYLGSGEHLIEFPSEFSKFDELLVLGNSTAREEQESETNKMNLCLFILKPRDGRIEIVPQDWFNNGDLDYGYQWVTRVAREPKSGKIYGEGFRISRFVLDSSLRQVEKWFHEDPFYGNLGG